MSSEEVDVIALVENLELKVPGRLPLRLLPPDREEQQETRVTELDGRDDAKVELRRTFNLDIGLTLDTGSDEAPESSEQRAEVKEVEANGDPNPKKPHRSRVKKVLEVRRNPLRTVAVQRKDQRAPSLRQRLLASRRRCAPTTGSPEPEDQAPPPRSHPGYMSTRSATRKQGNVGATYEAPTRRDEVEWKEWPVHGMHERPVYHPQLGLAAEYNGRLFASLDGASYREIGSDAQIEIVRLDSLERRGDKANLELARHVRQQQQVAANRQKLPGIEIGRPRLPASIATYGDRFHSSLGLVHHQQQHRQLEQIRSLERLQHLGSLQRARLHRSGENGACPKYAPVGRLLSSKDVMFRALGHHQSSAAASPSKCLILPRGTAPPTVANRLGLPFCEVQAVKSNSKGKLIFVKAPETPKRMAAERTSTVTSATQSTSVSWAEVSLRKRPDGTSALLVDVPRTYSSGQMSDRQSLGYPSIRLTEPTSVFRPKLALPREDFGLGARAALVDAGQQSEVLDLSKKDREVDAGGIGEGRGPRAFVTDLVHYFKNFGADDGMDLFDDPKNLT